MTFSLETYLDELRPLIDVDCGTYTLDGIANIAAQLTEKYQQMGGWDIKEIDCGKAGIGLEVRNKPDAEQIDILFIGHMDTVFPVGTVAERPMSVDDTKAYGPGVSDMKSGLLNIVYAMRTLSKEQRDELSICICMNPDEETGSADSEQWIKSLGNKSRYVMVAEAARADGGLVKARKGSACYKIAYKGVAAHAGNDPQNGRSAITEMAHWVLALNELTNFDSGTTLNVGVASGGTGFNIVPDSATAMLDVRFWSNEEYAEIETKLEAMAKKPFVDGVQVTLSREAYKPSMVPSAQTEQFMQLVEQAATELAIDINWKEVGGGSDANNTAILGVPTLDGFGPIGAGFHSDQEYLELESIKPRIELMIRVIEKIAATC